MVPGFRCDCPITSALDIVGDRWMLVIVKLMLIEGKHTFKDFVESDEAVATNILSAKLKCLENHGLIAKTRHPTNKKTNLYFLTEKGLSLAPLIVELALWSDTNLRDVHPTMRNQKEQFAAMRKDRKAFVSKLQRHHREAMEASQRS